MKLFRLRAPDDKRRLMHSTAQHAGIRCPANGDHRRGGPRTSGLLVDKMPKGPAQDFIFGWSSELLASDRATDVLARSGLTGFEFHDVRFVRPTAMGYREFAVTGYGGCAVGYTDCWVSQYCEACELLTFKFRGDPPWNFDGFSGAPPFDVFKVSPTATTLLSERGAAALVAAGLDPECVRSADEPEALEVTIRSTSMGSVPAWLDAEQRASTWQQVKSRDRLNRIGDRTPPSWVPHPRERALSA